MPKLTHSPPKLNKSLSMSDSDVDKLLKKDNALLETIHVTQRDSKRRRIAELESESETLAIRKIIREELDGLMSVLQQQNKRMDVLEQHVKITQRLRRILRLKNQFSSSLKKLMICKCP
jgi:hypothetical protein